MAAGRRYDENLLSLAPPATKAEPHAQDYDVGLLKRPLPNSQPPPVVGHALHAKNYLPPPQQPPPPPVPFWKSKTGIFIISIVAAVVFLAVVIGAAVGASRHRHHTNAAVNVTQISSNPGVVPTRGTSSSSSSSSFVGIVPAPSFTPGGFGPVSTLPVPG